MATKNKAALPVAATAYGKRAEAKPKQQLKVAHHRFLDKHEPDRKNKAGRDLIRAIFGKDSLAEDSVL